MDENTNGLLRQYFPKGTGLAQHTPAELDRVAHEINMRPRKTLGWDTPTRRLASLMHASERQEAARCNASGTRLAQYV